MIYYVATVNHLYTLRDFVEDNATHLSGRVRLETYKWFFESKSLPVATYILSDLERIPPKGLETLSARLQHLSAVDPKFCFINDPLRFRRRYELLRRLFLLGINSFNVYRVTDGNRPGKYPVFIRHENSHDGPETELIHSEAALQKAIDALADSGKSRDDRIIVEYCAEPDDKGHFSKYGCFRVGEHIIPQDRLVGSTWCVKNFEIFDERAIKRDLAYVQSSEHNEQIRRIFEIARIEFGRIDYAIVNGRIECYEINTNPHCSYRGFPLLQRSGEIFTPKFLEAILSLDSAVDTHEAVDSGPQADFTS
jgi:hypothetical protein